jgi:hypothetical protein
MVGSWPKLWADDIFAFLGRRVVAVRLNLRSRLIRLTCRYFELNRSTGLPPSLS